MPRDRFGTDKDVEDLIRRARRAGWGVTVDGSTHLRWQAPGGGEFRCPLTGGSSVTARVRSQLRRLDPDHFGAGPSHPAPDEPEPRAAEPPPPVLAVDLKPELAEAAGVAADLVGALERAHPWGDPDALADRLRSARDELRRVEDGLRERARAARRPR